MSSTDDSKNSGNGGGGRGRGRGRGGRRGRGRGRGGRAGREGGGDTDVNRMYIGAESDGAIGVNQKAPTSDATVIDVDTAVVLATDPALGKTPAEREKNAAARVKRDDKKRETKQKDTDEVLGALSEKHGAWFAPYVSSVNRTAKNGIDADDFSAEHQQKVADAIAARARDQNIAEGHLSGWIINKVQTDQMGTCDQVLTSESAARPINTSSGAEASLMIPVNIPASMLKTKKTAFSSSDPLRVMIDNDRVRAAISSFFPKDGVPALGSMRFFFRVVELVGHHSTMLTGAGLQKIGVTVRRPHSLGTTDAFSFNGEWKHDEAVYKRAMQIKRYHAMVVPLKAALEANEAWRVEKKKYDEEIVKTKAELKDEKDEEVRKQKQRLIKDLERDMKRRKANASRAIATARAVASKAGGKVPSDEFFLTNSTQEHSFHNKEVRERKADDKKQMPEDLFGKLMWEVLDATVADVEEGEFTGKHCQTLFYSTLLRDLELTDMDSKNLKLLMLRAYASVDWDCAYMTTFARFLKETESLTADERAAEYEKFWVVVPRNGVFSMPDPTRSNDPFDIAFVRDKQTGKPVFDAALRLANVAKAGEAGASIRDPISYIALMHSTRIVTALSKKESKETPGVKRFDHKEFKAQWEKRMDAEKIRFYLPRSEVFKVARKIQETVSLDGAVAPLENMSLTLHPEPKREAALNLDGHFKGLLKIIGIFTSHPIDDCTVLCGNIQNAAPYCGFQIDGMLKKKALLMNPMTPVAAASASGK